jgi:hypothetical protein
LFEASEYKRKPLSWQGKKPKNGEPSAVKGSYGVYMGHDQFNQFPVRLLPMDNTNPWSQGTPLNRICLFEEGNGGGSHESRQVGNAAVMSQVEGGRSQNLQQLFLFKTKKDFQRANTTLLISKKGLKGSFGGAQEQSGFEVGKPLRVHTFIENIQPEIGGMVFLRTPGPGMKDHSITVS